MPYSTKEAIEPFWAEYSSAASGRDPLAIQNSSVVIYSNMVRGITNVTNRLRYNGFFCWVFDIILRRISKRNSLQEQIRYSRRSELLLAYIMVSNFPDVTGVSGSNYPRQHLSKKIDLAKGADWEFKKKGKSVYWQNSQGIFGQYYSAVMRELNLINHPGQALDLNIYTLTDKGLELAKYFEQNISENEIELFWKAVESGFIEEDQLQKLNSFALHKIPQESNEQKFYRQMLFGADDRKVEPTFNRRNTIKLLLRYLNSVENGVDDPVTSFLKANYDSHIKLSQLPEVTATAWYLYEMNELLHVAFEHFHSSFLHNIETYPTNLDTSIDKLTRRVSSALDQQGVDKASTLRELTAKISPRRNDVHTFNDNAKQFFKEEDFGRCIEHSIYTILCVQLNSEHHLDQLKSFAETRENNFNRYGYVVELLSDLVHSKWNLTIEDYIRTILIQAINLHTYSSYRKTKIGQSLVHNYMIEDNTVWRLRETEPIRTTPRLLNVLQYLSDIDLVVQDGKKFSISEAGKKLIK